METGDLFKPLIFHEVLEEMGLLGLLGLLEVRYKYCMGSCSFPIQ
jgi:hypothetical protein